MSLASTLLTCILRRKRCVLFKRVSIWVKGKCLKLILPCVPFNLINQHLYLENKNHTEILFDSHYNAV